MAYFQFYYPKRLSFYPGDYETPGLGGGESSIVLLAKALAIRGHKVEVYNACWKPGIYDGVIWRNACDINNLEDADVRVSVRFASSVVNNNAKRQVFWMLDDRVDGALTFQKMFPSEPIVVASKAMQNRLKRANCDKNLNYIWKQENFWRNLVMYIQN